MKINKISALFLTLTLSACSLETGYRTYYTSEFTWEQAMAHVSDRQIHGKVSKDNKTLAIGLIMSIKETSSGNGKYNLGECTGFQFDETTVATNAHCVPKKIRDGEVSCQGRVYFAHADSSENFACEQLLFVHRAYTKNDNVSSINDSALQPDVVIMRVRATSGLYYLTQSPEAIKKDEELSVYAMDPINDYGSIVYEARYSSEKVFKVIDNADAGYPYRRLMGQNSNYIIQGNSGSPVLDKNEHVKGIAYGGSEYGGSALIVDFSCLKLNNGSWTWKDTCTAIGRTIY